MDDAVTRAIDLASRVAVAESRLRDIDKSMGQRFLTLEGTIQQRLEALQKAKDSQDAAMDSRLLTMNHIKETLTAQADRFATRDSVDEHFKSLDTDIRTLLAMKERMEGAATQKQMLATAGIGLIALFIALAGLILKTVGG